MEDLQVVRDIIDNAEPQSVVFFGGAGVSTESGIPDFRSAKGVFNQRYPYPPEVIVSHSFFEEHPDVFYDFYKEKMVHEDAQPNQAHKKLAELEERGILRSIITQNVDGLHQAAGSKRVHELHGSIHRNYCKQCGMRYGLDAVMAADGVPYCECGGIIRPDVVLYEEPLDQRVMQAAIEDIAKAKTLIIAGTSRVVYPAAGLTDFFTGDNLIVINRDPSPLDRTADHCLAMNVGEVFNW
ncbi:NAD-dependent protein deacylase [Anaerotardibacter muris]|uniref:NAD-dependent protein deacylase n=1 Tax=Anaerotardibacter muris TaxID=2941505 RepID=UPI00203DE945|nr:NAD-dependent protein deacylase [Anaerotardibacter muris]